jgi:hypothetical protein
MKSDFAALPIDLTESDFFAETFPIDLSVSLGSIVLPARLLSRSIRRKVEKTANLTQFEDKFVSDFVLDFSATLRGAEIPPEYDFSHSESHMQFEKLNSKKFPQIYDGNAALLTCEISPVFDSAKFDAPQRALSSISKEPISDFQLFPSDLEIPGLSLKFPLSVENLPPATLLSCLWQLDVPSRVSLIGLELKMDSAILNVTDASKFLDHSFTKHLHFAAARSEQPMGLSFEPEMAPVSVPIAPIEIEVVPSFLERKHQSEDLQFIANAKNETQRLVNYHDGGRGDLHHFLALCAEFKSNAHLFDSFGEKEKKPEPEFAVPIASVVVNPRALSRRKKTPPEIIDLTKEAEPQPPVKPLETSSDLLSSFMKAQVSIFYSLISSALSIPFFL